MSMIWKRLRLGAAALAVAFILAGALVPPTAFAQTSNPPASATTITALQQALNKQGIAVTVDGILNDDTRAAIRKYQTQHHLSVTGEPDKATLDKLGVVAAQEAAAAPAQALAQPSPMGGQAGSQGAYRVA